MVSVLFYLYLESWPMGMIQIGKCEVMLYCCHAIIAKFKPAVLASWVI